MRIIRPLMLHLFGLPASRPFSAQGSVGVGRVSIFGAGAPLTFLRITSRTTPLDHLRHPVAEKYNYGLRAVGKAKYRHRNFTDRSVAVRRPPSRRKILRIHTCKIRTLLSLPLRHARRFRLPRRLKVGELTSIGPNGVRALVGHLGPMGGGRTGLRFYEEKYPAAVYRPGFPLPPPRQGGPHSAPNAHLSAANIPSRTIRIQGLPHIPRRQC